MQFASKQKILDFITSVWRPSAIALIALASTSSAGAATITFSGGFPGTQQLQSDGTTPIPSDGSFKFELGSFGAWTPTGSNTEDWLANWTPVTDPAGTPLNESTADFTTQTVLFSSYDGFSGTVDLAHNNAPFSAGTQGYVWGYDTKDTPGDAQWILFTRLVSEDAKSAWTYPSVLNAPSLTWSVGTVDTVVIGDVNGQQMTMASVTIPAAVPEPGTAALAFLTLALTSARRRRTQR